MTTFVLRPFERPSEPLWPGGTTIALRGWIEAGRYVVDLNGVVVRLSTSDVGEDANGPFARVPEQREEYGDGLVEVAAERDEEGDDGCEIRYYEQSRDLLGGLASSGIADSVNFIIPRGSGVSVNFNAAGFVDGFGSNELGS